MRMPIHRQTAMTTGVLVLFLALTSVNTARGQFRLVHQPERLHPGQYVNLFFTVEGQESIDGALVALPASWRLDDVTLVDGGGRASKLPTRRMEEVAGRHLLVSPNPLSHGDRIILRIRIGDLTGAYAMRITPVQSSSSGGRRQVEGIEALSQRVPFRIDELPIIRSNAVLNLESNSTNPSPLFDRTLGGEDSFTLELWLNTVFRGVVVLSTWDGDDESTYPAELLVDEAGHAVFFRGKPGEHRSMRSPDPIADGGWHHVAISHDETSHWSRLFVDGLRADSIYYFNPMMITDRKEVILGGRHLGQDSQWGGLTPFTGMVDEIRLWDRARDAASIRRDLRRQMTDGSDVRIQSFEPSEAVASDQGGEYSGEIVPSDLSFYESIRNLEIHLDAASVLLEWQAPDPNAIEFVIERGSDGLTFDTVARLARNDTGRYDSNTDRYRYRDTDVAFGVTYYRICQIFADGMESVSRAVKVGMGSREADPNSRILENFPNPFNPTTTIRYSLAESQHVQVSVWDLSGQLIDVLVDGQAEAGEHQVLFDAAELPSGTYFVRLRTAEGIQSHQIVLMK